MFDMERGPIEVFAVDRYAVNQLVGTLRRYISDGASCYSFDEFKRISVTMNKLVNMTATDAPPPWADGWHPVTKAGALTKRISKWVKMETGLSLNSGQLGRIGTIAGQAVTKQSLVIKVDSLFDWSPGDFGDGASCFFGSKRHSWQLIKKMGGAAVKILDANTNQGLTRALIIPDTLGQPVVFNSYGRFDLAKVASILASVEWPTSAPKTTPIRLSLMGSTTDPLHINQGKGILFHPENFAPPVDYTVADNEAVKRQFYDKRGRLVCFCEKCGVPLRTDRDSVARHRRGGEYSIHVCAVCYNEVLTYTTARWNSRRCDVVAWEPSKEDPKGIQGAPAPPVGVDRNHLFFQLRAADQVFDFADYLVHNAQPLDGAIPGLLRVLRRLHESWHMLTEAQRDLLYTERVGWDEFTRLHWNAHDAIPAIRLSMWSFPHLDEARRLMHGIFNMYDDLSGTLFVEGHHENVAALNRLIRGDTVGRRGHDALYRFREAVEAEMNRRRR